MTLFPVPPTWLESKYKKEYSSNRLEVAVSRFLTLNLFNVLLGDWYIMLSEKMRESLVEETCCHTTLIQAWLIFRDMVVANLLYFHALQACDLSDRANGRLIQ